MIVDDRPGLHRHAVSGILRDETQTRTAGHSEMVMQQPQGFQPKVIETVP